MVLRSWRDGLKRVFAAPAVIAAVFAVTLLAALPLAMSLRGAMQTHLGSSLIATEAADAVNYDWWQEFVSQATGIGTTFNPSVIGFATTLDSVNGLLDARTLITPLAWALGVYLAAWIFLSGGILDRYARNRRIGAHGFFAASGTFFFRFIRLGVMSGAVYVFLFMHVHEWLFAKWYLNATRDLSVERTVFYWRLLMYAIFAALLAVTATVFDYAKVRAVVEDRRSMIGALAAALRFVWRHPGRVSTLYAANAATLLCVIAAWALVAPGAGGAGWSMWGAVCATQGYVLARLIVKLQFMASETALFQRSLAHAGYIASPAVAQREPPLVEAL
jgi:hypothetical protein